MAQEHRTNIAEGRVDSMDKVLETPTTESLLSEYKAALIASIEAQQARSQYLAGLPVLAALEMVYIDALSVRYKAEANLMAALGVTP